MSTTAVTSNSCAQLRAKTGKDREKQKLVMEKQVVKATAYQSGNDMSIAPESNCYELCHPNWWPNL